MELGFRLLLYTNSKSCMSFNKVTFNLTLRDLERSNLRSRISSPLSQPAKPGAFPHADACDGACAVLYI